MVVFGSYDYNQLVGAGAALPIALWPLLSAAYDKVTNGRGLPVSTFLQEVSRISLPSLEDPEAASGSYREWLASNSMKALWETGFGTDISRFWVVQNILASVEPFRGQELPKTQLGIRVPLGTGDAFAAAVWMDMTLRFARWGRTLLNAFWTPRQTLLLHLGPPHVASFREMIAPTGQADHVADLCGPPTMDEATCRRLLGPQLEGLVERTDLSLASFLDGLS
jgi:type VI secretion system protein ImpM